MADISSYTPICSCPVCPVCRGANLLWVPDLGVALPQVCALQMTASFMMLVFYVSRWIALSLLSLLRRVNAIAVCEMPVGLYPDKKTNSPDWSL